MKILDRIGNEITVDDTLLWQLADGRVFLAHVNEVTPPGMAKTIAGAELPGKLTITVEFNLNSNPSLPSGDPIVVGDMVKTYDPRVKLRYVGPLLTQA